MILADKQKPLFGYIQRLVGRGPAAEDLFQEVMLRFEEKGPGSDPDKAVPWLFRVARNLAFDWSRSRKRRPVSVPLEAQTEGARGSLIDILRSPDPSPETVLERAELRARLKAAIDDLPSVQREVFVMRQFHEKSFRVIADELAIPLGTALGRMHGALRRIRREMGEDDD